MATVNLVGCLVAPNTTTTTYSSWCPSASRVVFQVDTVKLEAAQLTVAVDSTVNATRVADMYDVFIAFLVVFAGVWGLKALYNLFAGDTEK